MILNENPVTILVTSKNKYKEYFKLSRKILYKKYTYGKYSVKKIFTNYLIFNVKCHFSLIYKEFTILNNNKEFIRNTYSMNEISYLLKKILELYCLYSRIYPNYIILKENKFIYKNIRKKQKMIDEKNKSNNIQNNNISKDNELFTLSVRKEIKEFQDNSNNNIFNLNKNNNNSEYSQKSYNSRKINDNWVLISNISNQEKKNDLNNNINHINNISGDSFWTNDTNNLSIIINAINDKIFIDNKVYKIQNNIKTEENNDDLPIHQKKLLKIGKKLKKNINLNIHKKAFKKILFNKIDQNKMCNDKSRDKKSVKLNNKNIYENPLNRINKAKQMTENASNIKNKSQKSTNKPNIICTNFSTEKNLNKKLFRYYSIDKDSSDNKITNKLKLIIPSILKKKNYSKDYNNLKKINKESNLLKITSKNLNNKCNKYIKKKNFPQQFLKIILDESKNNYLKEKLNNKKDFKSISNNNGDGFIKNKNILIKKYNVNHLNLKINQFHINNLTESNSHIVVDSCNEHNSNAITLNLNSYQTTKNNINLVKGNRKNNNSCNNKINFERLKTEDKIYSFRDKILREKMDSNYIKRNYISPFSKNVIRRFSLSKSSKSSKNKDIEKINSNKKMELIKKYRINPKIQNKLISLKKNIRIQIFQNDNSSINNEKNNTISNNKTKNSINNLVNDSFKKKFKYNYNKLTNNYNRNSKNIFLRKNLSLSKTYNSKNKSENVDLSYSKYNNLANNLDNYEFHLENKTIYKSKNNKNEQKINKLTYKSNRESNNIFSNSNYKNNFKKYFYDFHKSKTENLNIFQKDKNITQNKSNKLDINKNFIFKRSQNRNTNISKDKINKNILLRNNCSNINDFEFKRFNNLSISINNNSNYSEYPINKNINNNSSFNINNITGFQTPSIHRKRLDFIKKFIFHEEKDKRETYSNNKNISNKITIKVNRAKFYERVKEKMKKSKF